VKVLGSFGGVLEEVGRVGITEREGHREADISRYEEMRNA